VSERSKRIVSSAAFGWPKRNTFGKEKGGKKDKTGTKGGISLPSLSLRFSSLDSLFPLPLPFLPLPPFDGECRTLRVCTVAFFVCGKNVISLVPYAKAE